MLAMVSIASSRAGAGWGVSVVRTYGAYGGYAQYSGTYGWYVGGYAQCRRYALTVRMEGTQRI